MAQLHLAISVLGSLYLAFWLTSTLQWLTGKNGLLASKLKKIFEVKKLLNFHKLKVHNKLFGDAGRVFLNIEALQSHYINNLKVNS